MATTFHGKVCIWKVGFAYELICSHRTADGLCNMTTMAKGVGASDPSGVLMCSRGRNMTRDGVRYSKGRLEWMVWGHRQIGSHCLELIVITSHPWVFIKIIFNTPGPSCLAGLYPEESSDLREHIPSPRTTHTYRSNGYRMIAMF